MGVVSGSVLYAVVHDSAVGAGQVETCTTVAMWE